MPRHKRHTEDHDGWTEWVTPLMERYQLACCDCGLTHTLEFYAVKLGKRMASGRFTYSNLPRKKYRVAFRAKRDNRATAQVRRWRKKDAAPPP